MGNRQEELKRELASTIFYGEGIGEKLTNPDLGEHERADLRSELEAIEVKANNVRRELEQQIRDDERELRIAAIGRDMAVEPPDEPEQQVQYKSAFDALFDNPVLKEALENKAFRDTKWDTGNIEFKTPRDPQTVNPDDDVTHLRPGIIQPFVYPQRVGGLFTQAQMDGSSISWLDAPVASQDGGADYVTYGGQKPDGDVAVEIHTTRATKIATTYTVPDDALDDVTGLRSLIENVLTEGPNGIGVKAEQEYIGGSGTGTPLQLAGIDSLSPDDVSGSGANTVADILYAALSIEDELGQPATAVVINPLDYFTMITFEGDDGRPLFAPFGGIYRSPDLGFAVVRSKAVSAGTAYVGAWNLSILYTRMATNVRATREGIGLADKNLTMFVAETRQALIHPYGASPYRTVTVAS